MSITTACRVELLPTLLSEGFFQALDACFLKNDLHIGIEVSVADVDAGDVVSASISERANIARQGEAMVFTYELSVRGDNLTVKPFPFEVALHYEKDLECRLIIIRTTLDSRDRNSYDKHEMVLARKLAAIALCLNKAFEATKTVALKSDSDDILFEIAGDQIMRNSKLLMDDPANVAWSMVYEDYSQAVVAAVLKAWLF